MLSQHIKEPPFINIKNYIVKYAGLIKDFKEQTLVMSIVFEKPTTHHVIYMPYQLEWSIKPDFIIITKALMKLTTVKFRFSQYEFSDKYSNFIKEHIIFIFSLLKNALIKYGCDNPPYPNAECDFNPEIAIKIANSIDENVMRPTSIEKEDNLFIIENII